MAQNSLGGMYYRGSGITRNVDAARYWLRKAAPQGDEMAKSNLRLLGAD